ncbi:MAG: isoprenylcysteine carboxylmethyltransferase family protein [Acidobacteria bacterium]|nr:isoprenylcysteine carboxylmethyltransferase family protein [Acidobacteriota bacterium]
MKLFDWVAAAVLWIDLPIPFYWLILHPLVGFWRRHVPAAYLAAALLPWSAAAVLLFAFHRHLFSSARALAWAAAWKVAAGLVLIGADGYLLFRAERELGGPRLVGHAELQAGGELASEGLYARMRHPRYTGMMSGVLGACLLAATPLLWGVAVLWWLVAFTSVLLEERELRARFGPAYEEYCRRVPRFLPFRLWPGKD